jgi:hypothetical protein
VDRPAGIFANVSLTPPLYWLTRAAAKTKALKTKALKTKALVCFMSNRSILSDMTLVSEPH